MSGLKSRLLVALALSAVAVLAFPPGASAQSFTAQTSPEPVPLTAGGPPVSVTVTTNADPGFTLSITYSFSGLPAGLSTGGSQVVGAPYAPVAFSFSATAALAPGTYNGNLVANSGGRISMFPMTVVVQRPDFTLAAVPGNISLEPATSGMVSVSVTGSGGFSGMVAVTVSSPASVSVVPSAFSLAPGGAQSVVVTADPSASEGVEMLTFTGTAPGVTGARTAAVAVTILPRSNPPIIQSVAPPSVVTGTTRNLIRLSGLNFQVGARITSASPGVEVTSARVLSARSAEVVVSVLPDAAAGPYRLDLTNPDGGTAAGGARLLIYPAGALAAPLAVTAAQIVSPRPWQVVEAGQLVYGQALLATSGTGTVVGTWLLDGIPFDRFTRVVSSGFPVEVRSSIPIPPSVTGERRLGLQIEAPATLPRQGVPFLQAAESNSALRILAPGEAGFDPTTEALRWTIVPGASGYEVEIERVVEARGNEADGPLSPTVIRRRVRGTEWQPGEALFDDLGRGLVRIRVRAVFPGEVLEEPTPWRIFRVGSVADGDRQAGTDVLPLDFVLARRSVAGPSTGPPAGFPALDARQPGSRSSVPGLPPGGEWLFTLQGTINATESSLDAPPALGRILASTQADLRGEVLDLKTTADLSGSKQLDDPWDGQNESRNWSLHLGATEEQFRQQATLGFSPPSFFDQAEFLTVSTAGGAFEGSFDSPVGSLSYYRSVDLSEDASFSSFEPEVDAAAYEYSDDSGRFLFRTMLLEATDPGVGDFSFGGEGRALGVIGVADLGARLRLVAEAATGDFTPGEGSFDTEERDGQAFRLSADGASGTLGYGMTIGHTGEGFVNPANPGFTPGGVGDRTRGEVRLRKSFGMASLGGTYHHVRGGIAGAADDPGTTENGTRLNFSVPISQRVSFNLGGNFLKQSGDAADDLGLPATDRSQVGVDMSVSEMLGPVNLTQTITWQDFSDDVQPLNDQRVIGLSLFATGAPTAFLTLSGNIANTNIRSAPELGTTDQFLISFQPSLAFAELRLDVGPRVAFTRISNDVFGSETKSDFYQLVARWSPHLIGGLVNLEVAGDWSRTWTDLDLEAPPLTRQIVFTLGLNWRMTRAWPEADPAGAP